MSLILEALRKSEAERRRGRMPDLHAELPPAPAPRVAAKPAWPWVAGSAAVVAIGAVAWLALAPRTEVRAAAHAAVAAQPSNPSPALPPVAHLQPAPTPVDREPAPTPAERVPAPTVASTTPTTHPSAGLPPRPASAPAMRVADDAAPPRASPATTAIAAPPPAMAPPRPLPPPPASTSSGPTLALADLAPAERKALPPLKLSMHMWNDDASRRFVILDGNRLGEGDRIGDAVVTAITRDGVVLDWNGRALKVPLR